MLSHKNVAYPGEFFLSMTAEPAEILYHCYRSSTYKVQHLKTNCSQQKIPTVRSTDKRIYQTACSKFCPIIYVQCDSFGTRPKKMRISQRLFIRFWTCIYDYIPWFMKSISILVCRSLTSWRHRDNDWHLVPCRAQPCHCVVLSENLQRICG